MPAWALILIVLVVVAVVAMVATVTMRQRRTAALRNRFGPEYDRTLETRDDQHAAESELRDRQRRRAKLEIRPLPEASRIRYVEEWRTVQEHFVDQPGEAVGQADALLHQVMAERGYPVGDFAAQSDLVSVDHPEVVENYRIAHDIRDRMDTGQVNTEELREALLRYRSLFDDMLRADQGNAARTGATNDDTTAAADVTDRTGARRDDDAGDGPDDDRQTMAVPAQRTTRAAPMTPEAEDDAR